MKKSESTFITDLIASPFYQSLQKINVEKKRGLFHKLEDIFSENCSSRFLKYFLSSKEDHALGLKAFDSLVEAVAPILQDGGKAFMKATSTSAVFNWCTPEGRYLDILVTGYDERRKPTFVLGIENKIGSGEQENQVGDYQEALKERFPDLPKVMIFLTLGGEASVSAIEDEECPAVPVSHQQVTTALHGILKSERIEADVRHLIESYTSYLIGDFEMEAKTKDLIKELMKSPEHRKAISLIKKFSPSFGEFFVEESLPEIKRALDMDAKLKWAYPATSLNPHELNLDIGKINTTLRKKKAVEDLEGIYYMLKCGDSKQGEVSIGDTFDLLLMVYGSPKDRRAEIFSELGKVKLPPYEGTLRQWGPWTCIWAGGSYTLQDLGREDLKGLTALVKDSVDKTYPLLTRNL